MNPVVRNLLLSVPRRTTRYPCRTISNQRFPQPSRGFHQTPRQRAIGGGTDKADNALTSEDVRDNSRAIHAEDKAPEKDSDTALSVSSVKDLAHYGSAARRSKRSKPPQEEIRPVRIPEWFIDKNAQLVEDFRQSRIALLEWNSEKAEYVDPAENPRMKPGDAPSMEPLGNDGSQATSKDADSPSKSMYYVDILQWDELVSTARGLLRLKMPSVADDVASRKNHLVLHYAGEGGDYLLDEIIQKLAVELQVDRIVLDALDIVEWTSDPDNSSMSEDAADDRRLLSYDVYQREERQNSEMRREEGPPNDPDEPDGREANLGSIIPAGHTVFLDMRGPPLDLSHNDLPRGQRLHRQTSSPGSMLSHLGSFFSGRSDKDLQRSKASEQRLTPLIETLLACPFLKRTLRRDGLPDIKSDVASRTPPLVMVEKPLIVQIRDIKVLQQTSFGRKFLNVLYEQTQVRRHRGQKTIIIGTDTFQKAEEYSADNIRSLKFEPPGNISRIMVITPVVPSKDAELTLRQDKGTRIQVINLRHLWQMLSIKLPGLYTDDKRQQKWPSLREEFSVDRFHAFLTLSVADRLWTFDQVHRLATMIVGQMEADEKASVDECVNRACMNLRTSDYGKISWVQREKAARVKSKPDIERTESWLTPLEKIRRKLSKYEKKFVGGVIEPHKITTTFDHVHAPLDTIDALKTLTTLSLVRPDAFKYGVLASDKIPGLLLYGPPGTGKTLLAKAVAKESGATVLEVSGAELNDMYVGEGEKNVKALFSLAKKLSPCIIFIDEADSVFSARGGGQRRVSHRELLNQFLREWDGMSNDAGSAFLMLATNRPFDLDDAVLRRLPRRLLVDLPSEIDRSEILRIHLRDEILAEDVSLTKMAAKTPFYSGSDLKNLSVAAALNCVHDENEQAKNRGGGGSFEHAEKRTLTAVHFDRALEDISASISEDMSSLKAIKKFDEQFGDKRGRKKKSPKWGFNTAAEAEKALDTVKVRS